MIEQISLLTNRRVLSCFRRKEKIEGELLRALERRKRLDEKIDTLIEEKSIADEVDVIYDGVACSTAYNIETVEQTITRYARVSARYDRKSWILYCGDDPFGCKGEKGYGSGWSEHDAYEAGFKWVVHGIVPDKTSW